jgi:hypothetical protein
VEMSLAAEFEGLHQLKSLKPGRRGILVRKSFLWLLRPHKTYIWG